MELGRLRTGFCRLAKQQALDLMSHNNRSLVTCVQKSTYQRSPLLSR